MIIALFPNESKQSSLSIASDLCQFLLSRHIQVVTEDRHTPFLKEAIPLSQIDPETIDFQISLGGDGTILRLVHRHPNIRAPLLGINLGSLGFLADIPLHDIYPSLEDLLNGHYLIQDRMKMDGATSNGDRSFAVNEIVIHRAQNPCLVEFAIYVDDVYLNTFTADGMIISTPSGSTAYSLAAGGPIVTPELKAFVLTPICPHTISNRPIVLIPKKQIQVNYLSHLLPLEITFDGISNFSLHTDQTLTITMSEQFFCLVSLTRHSYFSTLREKLGWQGKLKV